MRKIITYCIAVVMLVSSLTPLSARNTESPDKKEKSEWQKTFQMQTVLEKGERTAGAGILLANFDSDNSELFLLANNIGANGNLFHIKPCLSYAYRDNAAIGARISFATAKMNIDETNLRLISDDLATDLSDIDGRLSSFGGGLFHRNYIGLDSKGTVGLFCEFELRYTHSTLDYDNGLSNSINQLRLTFSPGAVLYIMPMVSVEASIGLADLTYTASRSNNEDNSEGTYNKFRGGTRINIMNCNFGISYHF